LPRPSWLAGWAVVAVVCGFGVQAIAQQQRWAALDPNSESSSPVAWGATEAEARERAVDACKRVSKTCANGPASTDNMREVFAVTCCTQPRVGCGVSAAATTREAMRTVQKMLSDGGYSSCSLKHFMSAGSGKKQ
jgi:hypothetical protein